jgi:long-chain acyl-CoA synthetase
MTLSGLPLHRPVGLFRVLQGGLETNPDAVALSSTESELTWRELNQRRDNVALNLLGLGLAPGDRIASLMPNRTALIVHYLACLRAGLVAVPLNYRYTPPEIDYALELSGARLLLAHVERANDIAASALAGRLPLGVLTSGGAPGAGPSFEALTGPPVDAVELREPAADHPAFIFFTSGSTGKPKGVTHSHASLGWIVAALARAYGMTGKDVVLPGGSLSHMLALIMSLAAFDAGGRVVVAQTFDGDEILALLRRFRPTVLAMMAFSLLQVVRNPGATKDDFETLRICHSGGDKVPAELEQEFTALSGLEIAEGYGLTESGIVAHNPPAGPIKSGAVGPAMPGTLLSIRRDDGSEVAPNNDGRLWVKSGAVMTGYWKDPAATDAVMSGGWLDTGDVMRADADGYLSFRGRRKQIIVHDGSNISPQEVEDVLLEHPAVASAGVIGVHSLIHGENVHAYITLKEGAKRPTSQELIRFARARVGYKVPEEIVVLEDMPLNAAGKVDRVTLKRMAEERLAGAQSS